jgi:hypothetical protein
MHQSLSRLAAAVALLGLQLQAPVHGRTEPADPRAPELAHSSAFTDYKAYHDIAPGDWRRLNDTVGRAALKSVATAPEAGPRPAAHAASAAAAKMPMPHRPGHHPQTQGGRK